MQHPLRNYFIRFSHFLLIVWPWPQATHFIFKN